MTLHRARRAAVGLAAFALVFLGSGAAAAQLSTESPVSVNGPITDTGNVLADRTGDVRGALDDYFDATGRQLFVVFVPTFDGLAGQDWATASASRSDLASQDILLAVATDDRAYGYSVDDEQQLSDGDLQRVERDAILPRLRQEDWAGAAIAAAQGYADAAESGGFPWVPVGLGGAVVAGAGALLVRRRRRGTESTGDLDRQCAAALVSVDNTLTTSEQELAFAEAQFGTEATQPFRQVLTEARQTTQPESPAEHQRIATEILALCDTVETTIAEQVAGFDTLRDLQANAPDLLRAAHPRTALASVEGNVDQAGRLATESVQQAGLGTAAVADADIDAAPQQIAERIAEADLDELLAPIRAAAAEAEKARVALSESLGRVTSRVQAVSDYIDTRRGAVGADARTRLSEAARHLGSAQELVLTDPTGALSALTQAEHHVDDAERQAQSDVRQWEASQRGQSSGSSSGAVLGGIGSSASTSRRTSSGGSRGRRGGGGRF